MVVKRIYLRDCGEDIVNSIHAIQKAKRLYFPKSKYISPAARFDGVMLTGKHKGMVVYKVSSRLRKKR